MQVFGGEADSVAAAEQLLKNGGKAAAVGTHQRRGVGDDGIGLSVAVELDTVHLDTAGGEQIRVIQRIHTLAGKTQHTLPTAKHGADTVEPALQNGHGTGQGDEEAGGHGHQQGGGKNLNAHGRAVQQTGGNGNAAAEQQCQKRIDILHLLRAGNLLIGVHEILHFTLPAHDGAEAVVVIGTSDHTMQMQ